MGNEELRKSDGRREPADCIKMGAGIISFYSYQIPAKKSGETVVPGLRQMNSICSDRIEADSSGQLIQRFLYRKRKDSIRIKAGYCFFDAAAHLL